ncbi:MULTISPECIES: hypothetical protein [unclassified Tenacibaculum]|uniref:hypothetical protein n=1 Tax=unclassified Tenacibaculum TaxID=2635139 RepID=UPI001F259716|nr:MULTISPECIES: hypothetical protein [unclassified Tenacibaculum]MCF2875442.1 hypothetical protein [Tenacibaculum sp. Cn5-1]MCF2935518.1 hypothetical protein [Tenacibaculum sp. Cn5-34]MCG7512078.1 hypothetical protein [Tenacibaculum sp. Cn5-46]
MNFIFIEKKRLNDFYEFFENHPYSSKIYLQVYPVTVDVYRVVFKLRFKNDTVLLENFTHLINKIDKFKIP